MCPAGLANVSELGSGGPRAQSPCMKLGEVLRPWPQLRPKPSRVNFVDRNDGFNGL